MNNLPLLTYFLRCLHRIREKYITAKAASNAPPKIKIKGCDHLLACFSPNLKRTEVHLLVRGVCFAERFRLFDSGNLLCRLDR